MHSVAYFQIYANQLEDNLKSVVQYHIFNRVWAYAITYRTHSWLIGKGR